MYRQVNPHTKCSSVLIIAAYENSYLNIEVKLAFSHATTAPQRVNPQEFDSEFHSTNTQIKNPMICYCSQKYLRKIYYP